ncbi:MAG: pyridoxal-phosphate dependent enzyme [Proteobacteria bacterium]|nr:pyridoxal-phosphate dependent enzyme [Pseudomonadota bacterium]
MPLHIPTPLIESRPLSASAGREVWLKLEALQPSGSFKLRGVGAACETHARRGATRLVSSSGGNAGLAVAYAGRRLGMPVLVVVPETATERARALIRQEGAELVVHGASWQEANARAMALLTASDAFIHPFDDPLLWDGHATLIDEVARAEPPFRPEAVVLSVGGGGLLCGVVQGLHRQGWHDDVPVVAVETEGAATLAASLAAGRRVELDAITSIATSLGAKQVCEQAYAWTARHPIASVVVSDLDAVKACERFIDDHRIVVEPACGAALAVAYAAGAPALAAWKRVLIVVCGGATASTAQLAAWSASLR